tara:strand:- start:343 stop:675 length:333 start_codon:yes stop_codon:yes gene_type:complete
MGEDLGNVIICGRCEGGVYELELIRALMYCNVSKEEFEKVFRDKELSDVSIDEVRIKLDQLYRTNGVLENAPIEHGIHRCIQDVVYDGKLHLMRPTRPRKSLECEFVSPY